MSAAVLGRSRLDVYTRAELAELDRQRRERLCSAERERENPTLTASGASNAAAENESYGLTYGHSAQVPGMAAIAENDHMLFGLGGPLPDAAPLAPRSTSTPIATSPATPTRSRPSVAPARGHGACCGAGCCPDVGGEP